MSVSDFWVAAGTVAIEYGIELDGVTDEDLTTFPLYFGRTDCSNSPDINHNDTETKDFSEFKVGSWANLENTFDDELNFTVRDVVTIMGMHTLGDTPRATES